MNIYKKSILPAFVILIPFISNAQTILNYTIAKWYDNKKAASSITLDDAIGGQFTDGIPILDANNIKATFFLTSQNVTSQLGGWPVVLKASRGGHEMANHTVTHPSLATLSEAEINKEFKNCNDAISANTRVASITMAYPNGSGGDNTAADQKVRNIAKQYFIGARAVGGDYNEYNYFDTEENYFKVRSPMIDDGTSAESIANMLSNTINAGGWYCPTYHGIENGWIIVPKILFEAHVKEFIKRKEDLWMSTFANVLKYHRERKSAKLTKVSEDAKTWILSLSDTLSNNTAWNQALTLNIDKPNWNVFYISQNGKDLAYTTVGNQIVFSAIPDAGNITIGKEAPLAVSDLDTPQNTWSVVPNPIGETINIMNLIDGKEYQINITSMSGDTAIKQELIAKNNQIKISTKNLKKGIYIINIDGISHKVIIQ